jgi:N utilization substance protein A
MGKKETINLIDTFSEFKELKSIDRMTLISVMEESFRSVISKMFGSDDNFDVIINPDKGDFEIYRNRTVVEDDAFEDENTQIKLSEALKVDEDFEVGEEVTDALDFMSFGRRAILNLRQTLSSKILELQKENVFAKYSEKIGQIVNAELYQIWKREMLLLDEDGNELYLPKSEQIPTDFYRKGDTVRAVVAMVENKNNNPKIILSRVSPVFLERLFELEVPEINEGLITIKKIARMPGERAKVAVESYDDRVDPVGACVGVKGSRIHGIVRELRNENIDVINFTNNISLFIQRSLSPAKISSIRLNETDQRAEIYMRPEEVSLAIGKGGLNIKLAGMLTGYTLDVYRELDDEEETEDIYLDEFNDEIEQWVIDVFKNIGYDTAKSVLAVPRQDLIKRTDLEEETIDDALAVLRAEFEDEYYQGEAQDEYQDMDPEDHDKEELSEEVQDAVTEEYVEEIQEEQSKEEEEVQPEEEEA